MLNEQDSNLELVADFDDVLHQLRRFVRIHARGGFVQQQKRRIRRQRAHNLQAPLCAVGEGTCLDIAHVFHAEDAQQIQRLFVLLLLALPILRQTEDAGKHAVLNLVVQADADVLFHRHVVEQADVLERAGNAELTGLHCVHACRVLAVDECRLWAGRPSSAG